MASAKATADEEEASKASGKGGGGGPGGPEEPSRGGGAAGGGGAGPAGCFACFAAQAQVSKRLEQLRHDQAFRGGNPVSASAGASASSEKPLSRRPTGSCWGNATRSEERDVLSSARVGEEKPQCLNVSSVFLRCRFGRRRNLESELQLLGAEAAASANSRTPFLSLSISADSRKCS